MARTAHYHVGNNTPGYIPDDEPFVTWDLKQAGEGLKEDVEHWTENGWDTAGLDLCDEDCFSYRYVGSGEPMCGIYHSDECVLTTVCLVKHESIYDVTFADDGMSAFVRDRTKTYDLGRSFWVNVCYSDECKPEAEDGDDDGEEG